MNRVAKLWGGVAGGLGAAGGLLNASLGMLKAAVPGTQRDMVKLRLQRFGRRNLPFYRIVAADARHKRDGRCIEYLGTYNPIANKFGEKLVTLNMEVLTRAHGSHLALQPGGRGPRLTACVSPPAVARGTHPQRAAAVHLSCARAPPQMNLARPSCCLSPNEPDPSCCLLSNSSP